MQELLLTRYSNRMQNNKRRKRHILTEDIKEDKILTQKHHLSTFIINFVGKHNGVVIQYPQATKKHHLLTYKKQ